MKILSNKEYNALQTELKGFYDDRNQQNQYFKLIRDGLRGLDMAPVLAVDRLKIKEIYETSAPVQGVVNYIADNVGEVLRYLELTKDGQYVEDHWIYSLLRRPNDRFSTRKYGQAWAVNKCLYGDAWNYGPKAVGVNRGRIEEMYVIPSWRIVVDKDGVIKPLKGIRLAGTVSTRDIPVEDIWESFDYNLDDTSFFGTSKIVAAAVYLSVMRKGMNREDTSLHNGGVANIITPAKDNLGVMPKDSDTVEERFNRSDNSGKTLALRIPVEVHTLGNAPVDLNILESHKEAVTALCFVFKIPVDLYYGQAKYENAKEAKKTIYEQCAIPMANEFAEDLLHYTGLDREGYELKVNTDRIDVLKEKASDILDNLAKMHASLNEMREANGYGPIEDPLADQPIFSMGQVFGFTGFAEDINEQL